MNVSASSLQRASMIRLPFRIRLQDLGVGFRVEVRTVAWKSRYDISYSLNS